jgi:dolichyl-phosphate beta-glucosyltransferase
LAPSDRRAARPTSLSPSPARVTLVVPCYNEEDRLRPDAFARFLRDCPEVNVIFVDDGSRDGTGNVLRELCTQFPQRASLLPLVKNVGKAEAVRQGVLKALSSATPFVGFWDADLATPLESVKLFLTEFDQRPHLEIVMGARVLMLGRAIERHAVRHYAGRGFATIVSTMLRLPVYDTQCGAKLFRATPSLRTIFASPFLSRWVFDVEILARLTIDRLQTGGPGPNACVSELPLPVWKDIRGSKIRPSDVFRVARDLWGIHRWLRRARATVRRQH